MLRTLDHGALSPVAGIAVRGARELVPAVGPASPHAVRALEVLSGQGRPELGPADSYVGVRSAVADAVLACPDLPQSMLDPVAPDKQLLPALPRETRGVAEKLNRRWCLMATGFGAGRRDYVTSYAWRKAHLARVRRRDS